MTSETTNETPPENMPPSAITLEKLGGTDGKLFFEIAVAGARLYLSGILSGNKGMEDDGARAVRNFGQLLTGLYGLNSDGMLEVADDIHYDATFGEDAPDYAMNLILERFAEGIRDGGETIIAEALFAYLEDPTRMPGTYEFLRRSTDQ